MVSVTLKKIYSILFLFIYIVIIIFAIVILKKIIIYIVVKFPKDIFPIVLISVITSISLKLHQPNPDSLIIGSQSRKF